MANKSDSVTCTHCDNTAHAQGLCATHYQRKRRTGDPSVTRKPGRPERFLPFREALRTTGLDKDWSASTFRRFVTALETIRELDGDTEAAIKAGTRTNGTVNVAAVERFADRVVIEWCEQHPE